MVRAARAPCRKSGKNRARRAGSRDASGRSTYRLLAAEGRDDRAALEVAVAGARVDQRLQPPAHALKLLDLVLDLLETLLGAAFDTSDVAIRGQRQQLTDLR